MTENHYEWLDANFAQFLVALGLSKEFSYGMATAHGDKASTYRLDWEKAGVPFNHGVAIFLLSYLRQYRPEVRNTPSGWVDVGQWVIDNYNRFKSQLPPA